MATKEQLKIGTVVSFQVRPYQQTPFYAHGRVIDAPRLSAGPYWAGYIVTLDMRDDKKYCATYPNRKRTSKRIEHVCLVNTEELPL